MVRYLTVHIATNLNFFKTCSHIVNIIFFFVINITTHIENLSIGVSQEEVGREEGGGGGREGNDK